jgi:hemolysin III
MMKTQTPQWYDQRMADGGPVYFETNPEHFIVEPWNALSSLLYMLPALIFIWRLRGRFTDYKFLLYAAILTILGSLGSTLFHAFRTSIFFLVLDVLPVAILTLSLSIYFWIKVFPKWWHMLFILIPIMGLRFFLFNHLPDHLAINLSYALTGLMVILPLIVLYIKRLQVNPVFLIYTLLAFGLALRFREMDTWPKQPLPMGTHFLWHAFSGVGTWFILTFLYHFRQQEQSGKLLAKTKAVNNLSAED